MIDIKKCLALDPTVSFGFTTSATSPLYAVATHPITDVVMKALEGEAQDELRKVSAEIKKFKLIPSEQCTPEILTDKIKGLVPPQLNNITRRPEAAPVFGLIKAVLEDVGTNEERKQLTDMLADNIPSVLDKGADLVDKHGKDLKNIVKAYTHLTKLNNISKVLGYLPIIGTIIGLVRLIFASMLLSKVNKMTDSPLKAMMLSEAKKSIGRGIGELSSLGFLFLPIVDLHYHLKAKKAMNKIKQVFQNPFDAKNNEPLAPQLPLRDRKANANPQRNMDELD